MQRASEQHNKLKNTLSADILTLQQQIADIAQKPKLTLQEKGIRAGYLNLKLCYLKILYAGAALDWPGADKYFQNWQTQESQEQAAESTSLKEIQKKTKALSKQYKATVAAYAQSKRPKDEQVPKPSNRDSLVKSMVAFAAVIGFVVTSILIKALAAKITAVPFASMLVAHPLVLVPALLGLVIAGIAYIAHRQSKAIPKEVKQAYVEIQEYAHDRLPRELFAQSMSMPKQNVVLGQGQRVDPGGATKSEAPGTKKDGSFLVSTREWLLSDGSDGSDVGQKQSSQQQPIMMTSFRAKGELRPAPTNFSRMDLVVKGEGKADSEGFRLTGYAAGTPLGNKYKDSNEIKTEHVVGAYKPVVIRFARDYAKRYEAASDDGKKLMLAEGIVFNFQSLLTELPFEERVEFFNLLKDQLVRELLFEALETELVSKLPRVLASSSDQKSSDYALPTLSLSTSLRRGKDVMMSNFIPVQFQVDLVPMSVERVVIPWREDVYETAQANLDRFRVATLAEGLAKLDSKHPQYGESIVKVDKYLDKPSTTFFGHPPAIPMDAITVITQEIKKETFGFKSQELESMRMKLMAAVDLKRKMHRSYFTKALCKVSSWKVKGYPIGFGLAIVGRLLQFVGLPLAAGLVATALGATPLVAVSAVMAMLALTVLVPTLSSRRLCNPFSLKNWRLNFYSVGQGSLLLLAGAAFIVLPFVFGGSFAAATALALLATALPVTIGALTLVYAFFSFGGQQNRYMSMSADSHILADGYMSGCKTARDRLSIFYAQMKTHIKKLHGFVPAVTTPDTKKSEIQGEYAKTNRGLKVFALLGIVSFVALIVAVVLIIIAAPPVAVVATMISALVLLGVSWQGMQYHAPCHESSYLDAQGIDNTTRDAFIDNAVNFSKSRQSGIVKVTGNLADMGALEKAVDAPFRIAANVKKYKAKLGLMSEWQFKVGFLLLTVAVVVTAVIPAANIASLILMAILLLLTVIAGSQAMFKLGNIHKDLPMAAPAAGGILAGTSPASMSAPAAGGVLAGTSPASMSASSLQKQKPKEVPVSREPVGSTSPKGVDEIGKFR